MANINSMSQSGSKVYLNVYDLHENNDMLHPLGLGLFHSGVQVGRTEYTFGMFIIIMCFYTLSY